LGSVSVKRVFYICTVKATTGDSSTSIAKVGAGVASALAVYIVANFALQADAYCAKGGVLEASCVAVNTRLIAHVCDIIASKSLAGGIYRILSEILHLITLYARPCRFITI
jgi:hypothetical protein